METERSALQATGMLHAVSRDVNCLPKKWQRQRLPITMAVLASQLFGESHLSSGELL